MSECDVLTHHESPSNTHVTMWSVMEQWYRLLCIMGCYVLRFMVCSPLQLLTSLCCDWSSDDIIARFMWTCSNVICCRSGVSSRITSSCPDTLNLLRDSGPAAPIWLDLWGLCGFVCRRGGTASHCCSGLFVFYVSMVAGIQLVNYHWGLRGTIFFIFASNRAEAGIIKQYYYTFRVTCMCNC